MSSQAQVRANQQNAQKSTGPKTEQGKARSAQNARIHGFAAQSLIFPSKEEHDQFLARCQELSDQYPFEHAVKQSLVTALAGAESQIRLINLTKRGLYRQILSGLGPKDAGTLEPGSDAYLNLVSDVLGHAVLRNDRNAEALLKLNRYELEQRRLFYKALQELEALNRKQPAAAVRKPAVRTGEIGRRPYETKPISPARKRPSHIPDAA